MISLRYSLRSMAMLCIVMMVAACQSSSDKNDGQSPTTAVCDTALLGQYRHIKNKQLDPLSLSKAIKEFYEGQPVNCRTILATNITLDLFDIVYNNHRTDTIIIPFFLKLSQAKELTKTQREKALLGIAAYYLYGMVQTDSAEVYLQQVTQSWPEMNDTVKKTYHSLMGQYMVLKANLKEAGDHYLKAIALCEKLKDSVGTDRKSVV